MINTMTKKRNLTAQQIFNKVAKHLLVQNQRSANPLTNLCHYHEEHTGRRCAIGCLLNPQTNTKDFEGTGFDSITVFKGISGRAELRVGNGMTEQGQQLIEQLTAERINVIRQLPLLSKLQRVHDYTEPEQWKKALRGLGRTFNLNCDILLKKNYAK